jgi:nucleoside-diphosphate-sugar epimerase
MRVLIAGAAGNTARRLVRRLVKKGHEVRGLVRKEQQFATVREDGAEPMLIDLEKDAVRTIGDAVQGCDAVVFAAGAGPGSGAARKETMDYGGAVKLIEAAKDRGVRRYLMLSAMGVEDLEGTSETMRPYLSAKARADERLRNSGLDYTIVRPGSLTDEVGTGKIRAAVSLGVRGEIPREDVADAFAVVLETENTYGKTFEILSGDTPIREAVEAL